jgi:hypothetical protein
MEINYLGDSSSFKDSFGQWGEFTSYSELHLDPGQEYRIRLIGPTYKARRTYVSRRNSIARSLDDVTFRQALKSGIPIDTTRGGCAENYKQEIIKLSNKKLWSKCLISSCVLTKGPRSMSEDIFYYVFSKSSLSKIMSHCSENSSLCLSGVIANDIILQKINRTNGFNEVEVRLSGRETYLSKKLIKSVMFSGMGNPKEHFVEKNNDNLLKKNGYFYSFMDMKEKSKLDKHFEPFQKVSNYIEEDREYNYIKSDPKKIIEYEGVDPFGFIEIN